MRLLAISDIHGCANTFQELLDKIELTKKDQLVLLGDYINRGPRSKQVLDTIIDLQVNGYHLVALRGNHEDFALDSINFKDWSTGMVETTNSFGVEHLNQIDQKYKDWLENLPVYYEFDRYIFVHAGFNFLGEDPLNDNNAMLWIRTWYENLDKKWLGDRMIIHGHSPINQAEMHLMLDQLDQNRVLDIDNGCVFKDYEGFGQLACVNLSHPELIFQKNSD